MKHDHFVVQSPDKPAQQLLLLFHGVGDNPVAMGQIGSWFAPLFPDALIVSIGGAEPCGPPPGRQWFSVQGVSEENRQQRRGKHASHNARTDSILRTTPGSGTDYQRHDAKDKGQGGHQDRSKAHP